MKLLARILSLVVLAGAATLYMSCKGDDDPKPSEEETQLNKLKGTWALTYVELDGEERLDFTDVVMTISGDFVKGGTYNFSFTGTFPNPSPWPKTGTFKFGSSVSSQLTRLNDSLGMGYALSNSDETLAIEFNYTGAGFAGGRVNEVEGDWRFVFDKQ